MRLGEIHVWWALARDLRALGAGARFEAWLSGDEAERHGRIRRAEDRELYLFARAALRHTLSRYADVAPDEWRFVRAEGGRPELAAPFDALGLRFSVSHTAGLVACLVSGAVSAGVDVERVDQRANVPRLAGMACSRSERAELESLAPDAGRRRFYELWTLKEAYVKARGAGLALPLNRVTFEGHSAGARFERPLADDPGHWQFALWRPSPEHQGAVAVKRGAGPDRTFVYRPALAPAAG